MTSGFSVPSSSRNVAPSGAEYFVSSLKMCPTSIATWRCRCAPQRGHASFSQLLQTRQRGPRGGAEIGVVRNFSKIGKAGLEVASSLDAAEVCVVGVGAAHVLAFPLPFV